MGGQGAILSNGGQSTLVDLEVAGHRPLFCGILAHGQPHFDSLPLRRLQANFLLISPELIGKHKLQADSSTLESSSNTWTSKVPNSSQMAARLHRIHFAMGLMAA